MRLGIDYYKCKCIVGFTGMNCETNIDDCLSKPCMNGGLCVDGDNAYTCNCKDTGYYGTEDCASQVNDCNSAPCLNQATCVDAQKAYSCHCDGGYTGAHCETDIDECLSSPCENGGSCTDGHNTYICQCTRGFHGMYRTNVVGAKCGSINGWECGACEIDHDECSDYPYPCLNLGQCYESSNSKRTDPRTQKPIAIGDFICQCQQGHTGDTCQVETMVVTLFDGAMISGFPSPTDVQVARTVGNDYNGKIVAIRPQPESTHIQFELFGKMCRRNSKLECDISPQDKKALVDTMCGRDINGNVYLDGGPIYESNNRGDQCGESSNSGFAQSRAVGNVNKKPVVEGSSNSIGLIAGLIATILVLLGVGVILVRKKIHEGGDGKGRTQAHVEMEVI